MPDDAGEKTEAPTPKRLQEAREKGQVAKSADLTAAIGLLAALIVLNMYGPSILQGFKELMIESFAIDKIPTNPSQALDESWQLLFRKSGAIVGPIFIVLSVVAVLVNISQVGFLLSAKPITPSIDKISPLQGFKRLFSMRTTMRFIMSMIKVILIGWIAYLTIQNYMPELIGLVGISAIEVIGHSSHMVFILGLRMAALLLFLAILDYAFQKWQMTKDLRMTKQEVKEELKRMEGDAIMRQRRRAVARELASQRMSQAVPNADVVITNPTHLAIALKYDHETMGSPKVVAKGADYMAARIRKIAMESGVPIVERKPLARALYKACDIGDFVPPELYKAIAEVLAYIFELAGKGYRRAVTV
jgi:flagellar biosynthetic protein FlhB